VAYGPVIDEAADMDGHKVRNDLMAAMKKQLAEDSSGAGYVVMKCRQVQEATRPEVHSSIRAAFASEFPALSDARQT
jgi:hypothetical protein